MNSLTTGYTGYQRSTTVTKTDVNIYNYEKKGTMITILYYGVLSYILVRRPTFEEIDKCE